MRILVSQKWSIFRCHAQMSRFDVTLSGPGFESQKAAFQKLFADFGESKMIHFRMSRSDVTLSGPGFESQRAAFQKLFADFGESKMVHFRMSRSDVTLSGRSLLR